MIFSTRTLLLRAVLTLGATAAAVTIASPAMAASSGRASDGAQQYDQTLCSTSGTGTECYIQELMSNTVTTPSGKTNVVVNGSLGYTATDPTYALIGPALVQGTTTVLHPETTRQRS